MPPSSSIDRRRFLLHGGAALAGASAVAIGAADALPACRALHDSIAQEFGSAASRARLAANNVVSLLRDMTCPCCGEPFLAGDSAGPRF